MAEYSRLSHLPAPLLRWYHQNRRILPWREDPQPYRVWVSEIMLQQTRVEAALPYYERFLRELPDIPALAAAPEEQLLKLWEGLGYYSRVRNLQKAARVVCEQYGGELPGDYEAVKALPGIGEYTAGAICSIAFGLPTPAVDGNVLRVVCRITGDETPVDSPALKRRCREELAPLYPEGAAGDFTQALMELGAMVCLPGGAPRCGDCPAQGFCRGYASGEPERLPVKPPKKPRRIERRQVWVVLSPAGVLLHRRPSRGLLAGLWELPGAPEGEPFPLGWSAPTDVQDIGAARHIFSHVEWQMAGALCRLPDCPELPEGWRWADAAALAGEVALPLGLPGLPGVPAPIKAENGQTRTVCPFF